MTTYVFFRRFPDRSTFVFGYATQNPAGWRFVPRVAGRRSSAKWHATMERCLPRWLGYPDHCESELQPRRDEAVRRGFHSAFLHHACKAGMDMGIVNSLQVTEDAYDKVDKELLEYVEDVLLNR